MFDLYCNQLGRQICLIIYRSQLAISAIVRHKICHCKVYRYATFLLLRSWRFLELKKYYHWKIVLQYLLGEKKFEIRTNTHWTYWLQILSKLCFQRVALSGNYEILAICTDKNTFFNDLDYKADPGQHFHKSEKSARRRHRHKIIKTNLKTLVSPLLMRT